jgi:catechol 2,3-dioxygenase-like lactoylglutathione lyase family enzyme
MLPRLPTDRRPPEVPTLTERTIPILPCRSIDDTIDFYQALGFEVTYRQERPNTYAVVRRGGIELQFFVLKALDPAQSYSTCYVLVADVDALYEAFATGLRAALGRLPSRGIPRITALKDMTYGVRQFMVVDPGGNYIRIGQPIEAKPALRAERAGRLERALVAATTLADSKMDDVAAARVLDSAFADDADASGPVLVRAWILRADLAYRLGDVDGATAWLAEAARIDLSEDERAAIADDLRRADDLAEEIGAP